MEVARFSETSRTSHCHRVQKFQNRIDIGGMILTGEIEVPGEKPVLGSSTNPIWTGMGLNRSLRAEGLWLLA